MPFELRSLGFAYGGTEVLGGVTASVREGDFTAILGPNGAGKSTLLAICAGLRKEYRGECLYNGREVRGQPRRTFCREVAFVPQSLEMAFPFTAGQVVMMGRSMFGDGLFESREDFAAAEQALRDTDSLAFRDRDFRTLSGGERQRVVVASALAQQPRALLLDEPTAFLDLRHQVALYALLQRLARAGLLVMAVTHDVNLAAAYADRVIGLRDGQIRMDGAPREVLTAAAIQDLFEVECRPLARPDGGVWITYG